MPKIIIFEQCIDQPVDTFSSVSLKSLHNRVDFPVGTDSKVNLIPSKSGQYKITYGWNTTNGTWIQLPPSIKEFINEPVGNFSFMGLDVRVLFTLLMSEFKPEFQTTA